MISGPRESFQRLGISLACIDFEEVHASDKEPHEEIKRSGHQRRGAEVK